MRDEAAERAGILATVKSYQRAWREGEARTVRSHLHEDTLTVWVVGLATGAVVALGPALALMGVDPAALPRDELLWLFAPFAVAVGLGMTHRVALHIAMSRGDVFSMRKLALVDRHKLRLLRGDPLTTLHAEWEAIRGSTEPGLKRASDQLAVAEWAVLLLFCLLAIAFAVGVAKAVWLLARLPELTRAPGIVT